VGITNGDRPADWSSPTVLLVDRGPPDPYYSSARYRHPPGRTGLSGNARRSIPNIEELRAALAEKQEVRLVRLEEMSLTEQIRAFQEASLIVAQHGAGLNGLLWSRPGAALIEIFPVDKLGPPYTAFSNMADRLGVRHYHVLQAKSHGPVDAALVARYVAAEREAGRLTATVQAG
jgi:hypothetical protein